MILVKRSWGIRDILKSFEAPGRKRGKPVGSYVDDLAQLMKSIILCENCVKGFNYKAYQYRKHEQFPYVFVRGNCDACRVFTDRAKLFTSLKTPQT